MKKIIALLLAAMLLLTCCACTGDGDTDSSTPAGNDTSSSQEETSSDNSSSSEAEENKQGSVTVGGVAYQDYMAIEDDKDDAKIEVVPNTLDTKWYGDATITSSKSDAAAKELRDSILNAKNTLENYNVTGTVYYISPKGDDKNDGKSPETAFRSINAPVFTMSMLEEGDAVLFERGGLWRLTATFKTESGVTYGAYGEGQKPAFYGSAENYAYPDAWIPSNLKNVWKLTVADSDIGLVVFNHGELVGKKEFNGLVSLAKNGDYYFNRLQDTLYLYCDKGNPGKVFEDIEVCLNMSLFNLASDATLDNLCLKYVGRFGIGTANANNSKVTNCEFGFIGGAIQSGTLRYGNGIQHWNGVDGHIIDHNWFYQIYDAAVTWQGNYKELPEYGDKFLNISYTNNLVEYAGMSFEFWHSSVDDTNYTPATVQNFKLNNNISRFAGYGFSLQRTDTKGEHIFVGNTTFMSDRCFGNEIKNNIFDCSWTYMIDWKKDVKENTDQGFTIEGNTYYQAKNNNSEGTYYASGKTASASSQTSLEAAVSKIEANPKHVEWIS